MSRLFPQIEHAGPKEHLIRLKKLKEMVKVPVIGSLNAVYEPTWVEYARELENTGIDALEINLYAIPGYFEVTGHYLEEKQLETVKAVKQAVKIPVSVKISPFYTNTLNFIKQVDEAGADAYVLFNRFFQPEIDPEKEEYYYPWELTNPHDHMLSLRYAGLLHGNLDGSICISRGFIPLMTSSGLFWPAPTPYRSSVPYIKTIRLWLKRFWRGFLPGWTVKDTPLWPISGANFPASS